MRYIPIYRASDIVYTSSDVYYEDGGYFISAKTNIIAYREAQPIKGGAYKTEDGILIPETDPFFNYFVLERADADPIFWRALRKQQEQSKPLLLNHLNSLE